MDKQYAVVHFIEDGTYSEIPSSWVFGEASDSCYWPNMKNPSNIIKSAVPPNNKWPIFKIKVESYCCKLLFFIIIFITYKIGTYL